MEVATRVSAAVLPDGFFIFEEMNRRSSLDSGFSILRARRNVMIEKHYRVSELAALWGLSPKTIIRMFSDEDGVMVLHNGGTGKRVYTTLSIPETVAVRVRERLSKKPLQSDLPRTNPLRVIRLRDLNARMPKKPGNVFERKAA